MEDLKEIDEYSAWENETYGGGEGDEYVPIFSENTKTLHR